MKNGWIMLHRSLLDSDIWTSDDEPYTIREAWIYLLLKASAKDFTLRSGMKTIDLKRGQLLMSVRTLAQVWHRDKNTVMRYLRIFAQLKMITCMQTPLGTVITIVKYGFYQSGNGTHADTYADTHADTYADTHADTYADTHADTYADKEKKDNNLKNDKKDKEAYMRTLPGMDPMGDDPIHYRFELFWAKYPKKKNRTRAYLEFEELNPDDALTNTILSALEKQCASDDWKSDGGRWVPYPDSWLKYHRWEDEPSRPYVTTPHKPRKDDYEQRQNEEHDLEAVPEWLVRYRQEHGEVN